MTKAGPFTIFESIDELALRSQRIQDSVSMQHRLRWSSLLSRQEMRYADLSRSCQCDYCKSAHSKDRCPSCGAPNRSMGNPINPSVN
jgi:rubrerythrin